MSPPWLPWGRGTDDEFPLISVRTVGPYSLSKFYTMVCVCVWVGGLPRGGETGAKGKKGRIPEDHMHKCLF